MRGTPGVPLPDPAELWDLLKDWFPADMRYDTIVGRYMGKEKSAKFRNDYFARVERRSQCRLVHMDHSRGMGR